MAAAALLGELHGRGVLHQETPPPAAVALVKPSVPVAAETTRGAEAGSQHPAADDKSSTSGELSPKNGSSIAQPDETERKRAEPLPPQEQRAAANSDPHDAPAAAGGSVARAPSPPQSPIAAHVGNVSGESVKVTTQTGHSATSATPEAPAATQTNQRKPSVANNRTAGDSNDYHEKLAAFGRANTFIVNIGYPGTTSDKRDLGVPTRAGISLKLDSQRARLWDPELTELILDRDGEDEKWTVHCKRAGGESASIAEFDASGAKLAFKWLNPRSGVDNLRDCSLVVGIGEEVTHFSLRAPAPVEPISVRITLDGPDHASRLETLQKRPWPANGSIRIKITTGSPNFHLTPKSASRTVDTVLPAVRPNKVPLALGPVYAVFEPQGRAATPSKADDEYVIRFGSKIELLPDGIYQLKFETSLLSHGKLVDANDADWLMLKSQVADMGKAGKLAGDALSGKNVDVRKAIDGPRLASKVGRLVEKKIGLAEARNISNAQKEEKGLELVAELKLIRDFCEAMKQAQPLLKLEVELLEPNN